MAEKMDFAMVKNWVVKKDDQKDAKDDCLDVSMVCYLAASLVNKRLVELTVAEKVS